MNPDFEDSNRVDPNFEPEPAAHGASRHQIVRKGKLILYNRPENPILDESIVTVKRYNCFGAGLFPDRNADLQFTTGITSVHKGDGKTLVSSNLAAFFALDTQDDTVLIDLNFHQPRLHQVFGIAPSPGVMESLHSDTITLSRSAIKGLWILPLGASRNGSFSFDKVLELREILATLKRQFRFVVIDLPSTSEPDFPAMVGSHLDGYFLVISAGNTKKTEVSRALHILNENKVIGLVMNRTHLTEF